MEIDPCGQDPQPIVLEEYGRADIVSLYGPAPVKIAAVIRSPAGKGAVLYERLDAGKYPVGLICGDGIDPGRGDGYLRVQVRVLEILPEPEIREDGRLHVRAVADVEIVAQHKEVLIRLLHLLWRHDVVIRRLIGTE